MLFNYLVVSFLFLCIVLFLKPLKNQGKIALLVFLLLLQVYSIWVLASFIHSNDTGLYKNVETHVVEHLGYDFSNDHKLMLMNADQPYNALFDEEEGYFKIEVDTQRVEAPFQFTYSDLRKPLLISTDSLGNDYKIANDNLPIWKKQQILNLEFSEKRKLTCSYSVEQKDGEYKHEFYFRFYNETGSLKILEDTLPKSRLNIGYPLLGLLEECTDIELRESEVEALEDIYLVRNTIYSNPKGKELSPLHIFLGKKPKKIKISLGADEIDAYSNELKIRLRDKQYFYVGIGQDKTEKLQLRFEDERSKLLYKLHNRYSLLQNDTIKIAEVLLSTSVDDIIKSSREYDGVINFEGRNAFNNIYHINTSIKYAIENGQTQLNAVKIDNNSGELNLDKIDENIPFVLKTNTKEVDYIVQIKNYNRNALTKYYWIPFMVLALSALLVYFILHKYNRRFGFIGSVERSQTKLFRALKIEYTICWVVTVFLTVRIYLLWRMYAFPPLENVTYFEFKTLQDMSYFHLTYIILILFFVLRVMLFFTKARIRTFLIKYDVENILQKLIVSTISFFIKKNTVKLVKEYLCIFLHNLLFWLALVFILWFVKKTLPQLFIVSVITIPLLSFIYKCGKIEKNVSKEYKGIYWILNLLAYLCIYYLFDKGFIIIALTVSILLFLIINTYNITNKNLSKKWRKYALNIGLPLFAFGIVFFTHSIISYTNLNVVGDRIVARGRIIDTPTGEMLLDASFNSTKSKKILWASESYWFADNHLYECIKNKAKYIYPKLRKQYNSRGVSLLVQTREFVLLRYLIFEHSIYLPLLLIAHFLALIFAISYCYYPQKSELRINYFKVLGVLLLFFSLSTFSFAVFSFE